MTAAEIDTRPKLRGYFHQEAFFIAFGACLMLVFQSSTRLALLASIVYSLGLLGMLGTSAIYHRFNWRPRTRAVMKRLDHSAIFLVIACSATPFSLFALSEESGHDFMLYIWSAAVLGIVQSMLWTKAPKFVSALFYIAMGWLSLPYVGEMKQTIGSTNISLLISGGIIYTIGAMFYAFKWPNIAPKYFGYHELFHIFVVIGSVLHFIAIYKVLS